MNRQSGIAKLSADQADYFVDQLAAVTNARSTSSRERILRQRQICEAIFKEAARGAVEQLPDLFRRMVYVLSENNAPAEIQDRVHGLRKLANKVVHDYDYVVSEGEVRSSHQTLADVVAFLSGIQLRNDERLGSTLDRSANLEPVFRTLPTAIRFMRAVVLQSQSSDGCLFTCYSEEPDDLGQITLQVDTDWSDTPVHAYATIGVHNVVHVGDRVYKTTPATLIVLEPDLLISATSISECFLDGRIEPLMYVFSRFRSSAISAAQLKGAIIGSIFRQIIGKPDMPFDEAFRRAARSNAIPFAVLGAGTDRDIHVEARRQYSTLTKSVSDQRLQQSLPEATLVTDQLGLQGRVDALFMDENSMHLRMLELKSGKPPSPDQRLTIGEMHAGVGVRPAHFVQTASYEMILRTERPDIKMDAAVLYPSDAVRPFRPVVATDDLKKDIIRARNQIAALDVSLAGDDFSGIHQLIQKGLGQVPPYLADDVQALRETLAKIPPLERRYFETYVGMVMRELMTARVGSMNPDAMSTGFARLWLDDLEAKERDFVAISRLRLVTLEHSESIIAVFKTTRLEGIGATSFRDGDSVVLYRHHEDLTTRLFHDPLIRGSIQSISTTKGEIKIEVYGGLLTSEADAYWAIESDLIESSYAAQLQSLVRFLKAPDEKKRKLLGLVQPTTRRLSVQPERKIAGDKNDLGDLQSTLLRQALQANDYFLLQGPPGTGKTKVMLRHMVNYLLNHTNENVLLVAFTNRAVQEMCEAIQDVCDGANMGMVKIGRRSNLQTEKPITLDAYAYDHTVPETRQYIETARVFVGTVHSLLNRPDLLRLKQFHTAIVDEASQLLEPHLIGILSEVGRFILIGDEKQLPAVITQAVERTRVVDQSLSDIGIRDLRTSLFERLLSVCQTNQWSSAYGMLEAQARMHQQIQAFPSQFFYANRLTTLRPEQKREENRFSVRSDDPWVNLLGKRRLLFVPSRPDSQLRTNRDEARIVANLLNSVCRWCMDDGKGFDLAKTVGVITPFRAQISEIRRVLSPVLQGLTIDTVERFQGSQREIVVLSLSVNHSSQISSIQSMNFDETVDRKLNVALTRAQDHLIVTGVEQVLRTDRLYGALIDHIIGTGGYVREPLPQT